MQRIDHPTNTAVLAEETTYTPTTPGYFTEGDKVTGTPATRVTANFLNGVQQEIINVILAGGITPTSANNQQMATAIQQLIDNGAFSIPGLPDHSGEVTDAAELAIYIAGAHKRITAAEFFSNRSNIDYTARDQNALTAMRLMLNTAVTSGTLVNGYQWELGTDEWGGTSTGTAYTAGSPNYYTNVSGYTRVTGATPTAPLGGVAANINDNNPATSVGVYIVEKTGTPVSARILGQLDFGSDITLTKAEAIGAYNSGAAGTVNNHGFYTSTDGTNWTQFGSLFSVTTSAANYVQTGSVTARYLAYAIAAISWSCTPTITDLNAYTTSPTSNMTLLPPAAISLASAPAYADAYFLWKDNSGSAALGTDITVDLSRDGGTNWTLATLTTMASYDGTYSVVRARSNLSANPTGHR